MNRKQEFLKFRCMAFNEIIKTWINCLSPRLVLAIPAVDYLQLTIKNVLLILFNLTKNSEYNRRRRINS